MAGVALGVMLLRVDVLFEYLTGTEGHDSAGRDADFFTGSWVPAFPGTFASDDKVAEACNLHGISLL